MAWFPYMLGFREAADSSQSDLVAPLLLLLFFGVLLVGIIFAALIYRHTHMVRASLRGRRDRDRDRDRKWTDPLHSDSLIDGPFRWIAVRGSNVHLVQTALGLRNPRPCSWEEGIHRAREHKLFISPPVMGWTLVMGADLPDPGDDVDQCFHFLTQLSRQVGEVQFFSVNRLFSHHAWVMIEHGQVRRAYAWCGQTVWNQGPTTDAERALKLACYDYFETPERSFFSPSDPLSLTTDRVAALAARWSVDPTTVDFRSLRDHRGISGRFSPSKPGA